MIAQVRIYTINKGMMEEWIKLFNEKLVPIHAKVGINIVGAWVNRSQNEFIWIRTFEDEQEAEEKNRAYLQHPDRRALGNSVQAYEAKTEVRTVEDVFAPVRTPIAS